MQKYVKKNTNEMTKTKRKLFKTICLDHVQTIVLYQKEGELALFDL